MFGSDGKFTTPDWDVSQVTALQKKVSKSDYDQDLGEIRADLASKADSV